MIEMSSSSSSDSEWSAYKIKEKGIKSFPSLKACIDSGEAWDLSNSQSFVNDNRFIYSTCYLRGSSFTKVAFAAYPGTTVLQQVLTSKEQIELTKKCLHELIQPPNKSNLIEQPTDLWSKYLKDEVSQSQKQSKRLKQSSLDELRWVTLGYHYDWHHRKYDTYFNEFPSDLSHLCSEIVSASDPLLTIDAQAGIINIYPRGSMMGGHQDDAEMTTNHPVVSISLGCPGVFLLGGFSKDDSPIGIVLKSGDVLLLGGESRLRIHGVAKVFIEENQVLNSTTIEKDSTMDEEENKSIVRYLQKVRININVRQVYPNISSIS